jgi:hypothetical protein
MRPMLIPIPKFWDIKVPSARMGNLNGLCAVASVQRHAVSHHEVPPAFGRLVAADKNASSAQPMPLVALLNQNSIKTCHGYPDPDLVVGIQPI